MANSSTHLAAAHALVTQAWSNPMSEEPLHEARLLLEAALAKDPDNVAILTGLGAILCDLQLASLARPHLERAVRLGSTDRNTYVNLFVSMLGSETPADARAALEPGADFERDPATWEAYFDPQAM